MQASGCVPLFCLLLSIAPSCRGFNLQEEAPRLFPGPPGSYFGLSVKLHRTSRGPRLLVGSPRANSSFESSVVEPGGLYFCDLGDLRSRPSCQLFNLDSSGNRRGGAAPDVYKDKKDGQWMGVALDATQGPDGRVVTCGNRWINEHYASHHLINGACYIMNAEMTSPKRLLPIINQFQQFPYVNTKATYGFAYGQAGTSASLSPRTQELILGAPGVWYWQGALVHYMVPEDEDQKTIKQTQDFGRFSTFSYAGYSVAVGRLFTTAGDEQYVMGAPRADTSGLVLVLAFKDGVSLSIETLLSSTQFGSYFGAAVCVVDLNDDGLDDLLVGAPLFTNQNLPGGDHGAVFMYISQDEGSLIRESDGLFGLKKPWARFGQAISKAGKLISTKYNSFVVGAPYEDGGKGAIYIYTGISKTFSQRIAASPGMRGFGYSVTGDLDVDDNSYPDIAVGGYVSDQAALFLARPVVNMAVQMTFDKPKIDLEKDTYEKNGVQYPALQLQVLLKYSGVAVPPGLQVEYTLEMDYSKDGIRTSRGRLVDGSRFTKQLTVSALLREEQQANNSYIIVFDRATKDLMTPFDCRLTYKLVNEESFKVKDLVVMLNATKDTQVYANVPFAKKCGTDDRCDSELQLRYVVETPTGERSVILGDERPLDMEITVTNAGEAAYQSVVVFEHPAKLRFRSLSQSSETSNKERVSCFPLSPTEGAEYQLGLPVGEIALLNCKVGNPIHFNRTVKFRVSFDAQKVVNHQRPLSIALVGNTTSNETLPSNNQRNATIPLIISTGIQLTGTSRPDQLTFEGKKSRTKRSTNDTLLGASEGTNETLTSIQFEHYFDVKNTGPGLIPRANFDVNIPLEMKDTGKKVVSEVTVTVTTYGESGRISRSCNQMPTALGAFPVTKPPRTKVNLVENEAEPLDLDCASLTCPSYRCSVVELRARESVVIKVSVKMNIIDILEDRIAHFYTEARLTANMTKENLLRYQLVSTTLYPRELVPARFRIKLWVLLLAVGAGILFLILLIITLYKLGFFKRKRIDDKERLVAENDDNETQEAQEDVDVKPPAAGGRDDVPDYEDNVSNNANHASYTAQSRTGPMYGQLSMIDDEVSDDGYNNNNNSNNVGNNINNNNVGNNINKKEGVGEEDIVEDRDEDGGTVLLYTPTPLTYDHPPAPPIPPDYTCNPLHWRPPPPGHNPLSPDGYLLPVERRQV